MLWLTNKVDVLEFHTVQVHSAQKSFFLPSVLKLKKYINMKFQKRVRFCREHIFLRDNFTCQYCHKKLPSKLLTIDHVMPLSRGGKNKWTNVVAACGKCNNVKGNKTPEEARMPLLSKPYAPKSLPQKKWMNKKSKYPEEWMPYLGAG